MPNLFIISHSQSGGLRLGSYIAPLLQAAYPGCALLNKAVGGSSIASWTQGQPNYNAALMDVGLMQITHRPACIISVIGETDAKNAQAAAKFRAAYWESMGDFRADIGHPYLPVFYVQLGPKPAPVDGVDLYPAWADVRAAQAGLMYNHNAYHMVEGVGGYETGRPYCHRTAASNEQQAALLFDAIKAKVGV